MALEIRKTFTIEAPRAAVWAFLTDPYRVARCLPGAAITEKLDDANYAGTITIKVGPVTASYRGKVRFEKLDAAAGTAEIVASGQDVKGKGGADMTMESRLSETARGGTEVSAVSRVNITGILAQMGARMIQDVSDQMLQKFTAAMQQEFAASGGSGASPADPALEPASVVPLAAAVPLDAVSLGAGVAGRALVRTLRRPAFWIGVAVAVAAYYWLRFR